MPYAASKRPSIPDVMRGRVDVVLGENARYVQTGNGSATSGSVPRPDFEALFGVSAQYMGAGDPGWGFKMNNHRFPLADAREAASAMKCADMALEALGYQKAIALARNGWGCMYRLDGAHILLEQYDDKIFVGLQQDRFFTVTDPFAQQPTDPPAAPTIAPTPAPTASTIVPGSQTLPSFGAYMGWTPNVKELYYIDQNGTEYWWEGYLGFHDEVRRAYLALLKEPRFGLTAVVDDRYIQGETGMVYESAFLYTGPLDVPPCASPLASGEDWHVYMGSSETEDVMFTFIYPKALMPADYGDRSPYRGMLVQSTPRPAQSTGQGGNSGGSGSRVICLSCKGTGVCWMCDGSGYNPYTTQGTQLCYGCVGTGECDSCNGRGWL